MWLVFCIGACLCWSVGTLLTKSAIRRTDFEIVSAVKTLVILLFAWYLVFSNKVSGQIASVSYNSLINLFFAGLLISGAMISYHSALKSGSITNVTATERITSILTLILGIIIFKEESNMLLRMLGIIIISVGVIIMITDKGKSNKLKWLIPGVISAILSASAIIVVKKDLGSLNTYVLLALCMTVALLISLIAVFIRGVTSGISRVAPAEIMFSIFAGILICVALLFFNNALRLGTDSISYAIMHSSTAVTVLLSCLFNKEKLSWKTACGLLLVLCGITVLIFMVKVHQF